MWCGVEWSEVKWSGVKWWDVVVCGMEKEGVGDVCRGGTSRGEHWRSMPANCQLPTAYTARQPDNQTIRQLTQSSLDLDLVLDPNPNPAMRHQSQQMTSDQ